ncbi:MAG: extracellular solute-binding protein [Faecalicatena sp.]|uniref:extracellular solute-binding protein n=1 Tax=Faecalicatena sp. TaxID=2005360 RepID=UPI002585295E|nr:extracellular solute-binding protein [Faecalicatena sp.]MCI6467185.1 extracellular solute-binding protein [Faecalicatena sp.]MDY5620190.1 extracellular solute-binding protein [Lachnospiraceae bacterium]
MKRIVRTGVSLFAAAALVLTAGCSSQEKDASSKSKESQLDPKSPVTIEVWHYYNGAQQDAFNELVTEFNESTGKELGIKVKASGLGNVGDLEESVLASIDGKVGAKEIPNIFAAYADTAFAVDEKGMAVDLKDYMTDEEISEYMDSYVDEGRFASEDSLKIFPVAKATEVFMLNQTDWDKFSSACKVSLDDLSTIEGITDISRQYYEWTDSLTDTPDDGKAFFGRDAMANYFIIGARELGTEIFSVKDGTPRLDFNKEVVRKLWDNYYVPFINGYFASSGKFRSDDIKTGNILAFVGSSAGATFFPKQVTLDDEHTYPIEMQAFECPKFKEGENYAVQQGAGMVVMKKENPVEIEASVEFLKWFTDTDRNIEFAVTSGYLPVKKDANKKDMINKNIESTDNSVIQVLDASMDQIADNTLYTTRAFKNGTDARNILEYSLSDKASADRNAIVELMKNGSSREEAVSQFDTDENFESWYEETLASLKTLVDGE